jgi:hypothetical protein
MSQMIIFLLLIMISTFALSAENPTRIRCSIQGPEDKVYYFDTTTKRYQLSVNEKGRPKTSLSRHIEQHIDRSQEGLKKVSYSFQIDDRTEVNVDMDTDSRHGTGEIKLKSKGHTKKFDKCKFVSSLTDEII